MTAPSRLAAVFVILVALAAGCGRETYLERLDETRRYFTYEERLNQNLTRVAWRGPNFLLRVPSQFQPIEPKSAKADAEARDPRQPNFGDLELPGLQGAWQASLQLTGSEGKAPAWLYLCSNFDLLGKAADEPKAAAFNNDVVRRTATAAGQEHTFTVIQKWQKLTVPPASEEAFVEKRTFRANNPGYPAIVWEEKPYRIRIYCFTKDTKDPKAKAKPQVTLLYVLPDNLAQASKLDQAIDLSLQTLQVTLDKPAPPGGKGAPKGKTSGKGKSF